MLTVESLRKTYGDLVALDGVDLQIESGEICGLLGPNGAGKTTLVSIVAGLRRADSGRVSVNGVDALRRSDDVRHLIGLAPQKLGLYPTLTADENLMFFGGLAGLWGRELRHRIEATAIALDLEPLLARQARTLSGGEQRRLHAAIAILHRPPLVLLDEPTAGADVRTRASVLEAVRRLANEDGCAICYSTHYLEEVEALQASTAIVDRGRVIARGAVADLVARHGMSAVDLVFEGPAPDIALDRRIERRDSTVRIFSEAPAADAASALARLGADADRLRAVEIVSSSLERVFLSLTGRRYRSDAEDTQQDHGPPGDGDRTDVVAT